MVALTQLAREASRAGAPDILLAEVDTPAGTERYHSGIGTRSYDGVDWTGLGGIASIGGATAEAGVFVQQVTASVAVDEAMAGLLDADIKVFGLRVWIAFLDKHFQVIPDPVLIIDCPLDTATIKVESGTQVITLVGNGGFNSLEQPSRFLWTNEQQDHEFPGDTGFDRGPGNAKKEVTWKP